MKRNQIDKKLQKRLHELLPNEILKKVGIPNHSIADWLPKYNYNLSKTNSLIRRQGWDLHKWNKFEELRLIKHEEKILQRFIQFIDMSTDSDPQWCFVTGNYIPPRFRKNIAIKPFPKSPWCYKKVYDDYINSSTIPDILTEQSLIICIADQPKDVREHVKRDRIENNQQSILKYVSDNRLMFVPEDRDSTNWCNLRLKYFIKPNGKPFTR